MALRILIVCHDFPPLNSVGARRPYSWARRWTDLGHEVHVLTTMKYAYDQVTDQDFDLGGIVLHAVPYLPSSAPPPPSSAAVPGVAPAPSTRWVDKLRVLTRLGRKHLGLLVEKTNLAYRPMVRTGSRLLEERKFDLIFSTSGPDICAIVGARLAALSGVAWVCDYRDLWFREFASERSRFSIWITHALHTRLLRRAVLVSCVSEGQAEYLEPYAPGRVTVCYNGFFRGLARPQAQEDDGVFRLVYTGGFYPGKTDPEDFLNGLALWLAREPAARARVRVDFFGPRETWIEAQIAKHGLGDVVTQHGRVSYTESLRWQAGASALLFFDWLDIRAGGVLSGKVFEYLASGRPVLCVGNREDSAAACLIRECGAGAVAASPARAGELLAAMHSGALRMTPDAGKIASFSREQQAEKLLDAAVDASRRSR